MAVNDGEVAPVTALSGLAFASLAPDPIPESDGGEAGWLAHRRAEHRQHLEDLNAAFVAWRTRPPAGDRPLAALVGALGLSATETVAVALTCAVETDPMAARVMAWLQAPVGGSRPLAGLVATLGKRLGDAAPLNVLAAGAAGAVGLIRLEGDSHPLPESSVTIPQPLVLALANPPAVVWPGLKLGVRDLPLFPPRVREEAASRARAILRGAVSTIAVRSGHPREARAAAAEICAALHRRPLLLEGAPPPGLGPWLFLASAVPVICTELAPGERRAIAEIPGWAGPVLIATGLDGSFERDGDAVPGWRVPMPDADERTQLWHATLGDADLATRLGHDHRHATVRIAELARAARYQAEVAGAGRVGAQWIAAAARNGTGGDLGVLAELLSESIPDDALILPEAVRTELESFADRCRSRDALADRLGPAARARYRPGVRALFVGPSGTGKTLAAGWLATGLGLPLYRVDLASVTSKFIGETEKNLAQLFARAEHAEVVLLFDEADSLFGKRTDVRDSNDRFANAQTNYLLTRIESFEGIAILTSNSRSRFDSAFTRRLDAIIEFTSPGPDERRALWVAHLGENHELPVSSLNRIAALCDLTGGHVRNVVLNAAARARRHDRGISERDLTEALLAEYTKLGRTPPVLRHASPPPPEA